MIRTKSKQDSLSTLIKKLDTVFSEYIRLRDCDDNGTVTCFITGERVWWRDADAAHWIDRAKMPTRYHEKNVHATTRDTNRFEDPSEHAKKYTKAMVKKYGHALTDDIILRSIQLSKFMRCDLIEMIETYTEKVKQLKKIKHL